MKAGVSLLLSLLMLLSSTGLTYAQHYCLGREMLSKVAFGEESLSCGMVMQTDSCDQQMEDSHGCCHNDYLKVQTDDQFAKVSFEFNFHGTWVTIFTPIFVLEAQVVPETPKTFYSSYHPPPLERDIQVWYETFLI